MPDRHFYLLRHHILFYIKFLLFCSLAPDEIRILCGENKGIPQKSTLSIRMEPPPEGSTFLLNCIQISSVDNMQ